MKSRVRLLLLASVTTLGLFLAAGAWAVLQDPFAQRRRFPDGSVMSLEAVTWGRQHTYRRGPRWAKLLGPMLPERLRQWARTEPVSYPTTTDTLVFWLERRLRSPGKYYQVTRATVLDESGLEADVATHLVSRTGSAETFMAWGLPNFPRRGRAVRIRFYLADNATQRGHVVEFSAPNPTPGPHPQWRPEALPAARESSGIRIALLGLETGQSRALPGRTVSFQRTFTRATFRITERGRSGGQWQPLSLILSDATGNDYRAPDLQTIQRGDLLVVTFPGSLWPNEAAWRLRGEFARTGGHPEDELWTERNLRLPGVGETLRLGRSAERSGLSLELRSAAWLFDEGKSDTVSIAVATTTPIHGSRLQLLRALDDRGRDRTPGAGRDLQPDAHVHPFFLRTPKETRAVDLTFGVSPLHRVEFLAAPSASAGDPGQRR